MKKEQKLVPRVLIWQRVKKFLEAEDFEASAFLNLWSLFPLYFNCLKNYPYQLSHECRKYSFIIISGSGQAYAWLYKSVE